MNPDEAKERLGALAQISGGAGQVAEGFWRELALDIKQGAPAALDMSAKEYADIALPHRHFAASHRQAIVVELIALDMSQRQIAAVVDVDQKTISNDLRKGEENSSSDADDDEGRDQDSEENSSPEADDSPVHVSQNSGEDEWYTPPEYIAAVRSVLGEIDLDPASSVWANATVHATHFYSKEYDGLIRPWSGRVFMNPPYSQPLIERFCTKFVRSLDAGDIAEGIVLVNNATETTWFQTMGQRATAIAFPKGRIRYIDQTGVPALTPLQGQAFLYFGPAAKVTQFAEVFSVFGVVR